MKQKSWPLVVCAVAGTGLALRLAGSLLHLAAALGAAMAGKGFPPKADSVKRGAKASEE